MKNLNRLVKIYGTKNLKSLLYKNTLSSYNINRSVYRSFSEEQKNNYKKQFDELLKTSKISESEVQQKKEEEEKKIKEDMERAKKAYDEGSEKLKKKFEQLKTGETKEEDKDYIEIDISKIKEKFKNVFMFNRQPVKKAEEPVVKEDTKEEEKKAEEGTKEEFKTTEEENKKEKGQEQKEESTANEGDTLKEEETLKEEKEIPKEDEIPVQLSFQRKMLNKFVDVWKHTFTGEQNVDLIMERRKQEAISLKKKIKEPTPEEIEEIENAIPEWKRGAVVLLTSDDLLIEKKSIFDIARNKLNHHIRNTEIYKDYKDSELYKELQDIKLDIKESQKNLREGIESSQNPFIVMARDLTERVSFKSPSAQAIKVMRKHDPNFDLFEFEKEVDAVFKQLMNAFVKDDIETVQKIAGETALGLLSGVIKAREERGVECKYKEVLYIDKAMYNSANVIDSETCVLRFRINAQEVLCLVNKKDGKIVEGDLSHVESCQYVVDITRNPNPIIEEVGHPWLIIGLERVGVVKQLV